MNIFIFQAPEKHHFSAVNDSYPTESMMYTNWAKYALFLTIVGALISVFNNWKKNNNLPAQGPHLGNVQVNSFQSSAQHDSLSRSHTLSGSVLSEKHLVFSFVRVANDGWKSWVTYVLMWDGILKNKARDILRKYSCSAIHHPYAAVAVTVTKLNTCHRYHIHRASKYALIATGHVQKVTV